MFRQLLIVCHLCVATLALAQIVAADEKTRDKALGGQDAWAELAAGTKCEIKAKIEGKIQKVTDDEVHFSVTIPSGNQCGMPLFADLPYVSRVFKNTGTAPDTTVVIRIPRSQVESIVPQAGVAYANPWSAILPCPISSAIGDIPCVKSMRAVESPYFTFDDVQYFAPEPESIIACSAASDCSLCETKCKTSCRPDEACCHVASATTCGLVRLAALGSVAGAEQLVAAAAQAGVVLQVGHVERFNRAVRAALPYLEEPRFLQSERLAPFSPRGTDVAVILDLMIHDLDLVLELVRSEATDVRAMGVPILTPHVDIANARVEFDNGAVALITASRVSRERTRKLRIFQPTGYFSLDLAAGGGHFYRLKPGWQALGATKIEDIVEHVRLDAPEAEPLKLELESFLAAVRGDSEVVVSGAAGAQALALALRVAHAVHASSFAAAGRS